MVQGKAQKKLGDAQERVEEASDKVVDDLTRSQRTPE